MSQPTNAFRTILPGIHQVSLGFVNAFLLEGSDGLTLMDTGIANSEAKILAAVRQLGKTPQAVRRILITHLHADHTGSLWALKQATGAQVYAHTVEAPAIRAGQALRPVQPAPGWINQVVINAFMKRARPAPLKPVEVEHELSDGELLPGILTTGLKALHTPGHTAGHLVFWTDDHGGVMWLGDAASAMFGLGYPPIFEDMAQGVRSLRRIAEQDFAAACFSHGGPILRGASDQFRQKWGQAA